MIGIVPAAALRPDPERIVGLAPFTWGETNLGRTAAVADLDGFDLSLAHEMGHLLGCQHALAGQAAVPDPDYPRADGRLDAAGFDLEAMRPVDPDTHIDLMGYGIGRWVSAFTWTKALRRLTAGEVQMGPEDRGLRPCLWLAGTLAAGTVHWYPAFQLPGRPRAPEPGPYTLECLDRHGRVLAQAPFAVHAPEAGGEPAFELLLPWTEAMEASLHAFQVVRDGQPLPLVASWSGQSLAGGTVPALAEHAVVQEPTLHRSSATWALDWDPGVYPSVLVLDPRTGQHLATLAAGSAEFPDPGLDEVELRLSDGIRTRVRRLRLR